MKRIKHGRKMTALLLSLATAASLVLPAAASPVPYMPGVTSEMAEASYWAALHENTDEIILTEEEIEAFNVDTYIASGTMVMDLRTVKDTFDGKARNKAVYKSSTADAEYYYGWTYGPDGEKADWTYYQKMIDNCVDPNAKTSMPLRYGVAVERTTLQVLPSENPIWDDPKDQDFDYQHLSAVQVNDPVVLFTTSADGKFYLARSRDCSGWIPAEDVAVCADKEEWLSAWDLPSEQLLVVYGNKIWTDQSFTAPETARRMLAQGTKLEIVTGLQPDQLVNNRSPYHNYVVYLPVRREDGSYEKKMALIPETAPVSEGYLPLTEENIAMVMLNNLGDAYGWGGMMDVEDCSGMVRSVYACFGLEIGRNNTWQWNMNMEKIDLTNMSTEEKCAILDELPLGSALCFPGHEMMYLGEVDGDYYVISTASSIMSPDTGKRLRTRDVMINNLDVRRANGMTWMQALNKAYMPCYAQLEGKSYEFPGVEWYHDGVYHTLQNGLIDSYADGYFGLNDPADRGTAVTALWRMAGKPEVETDKSFTDVAENETFRKAVLWAAENAVAQGYGDGTFGAKDPITREQVVAIMWKYARMMGYDLSVGEDTNILSYEDCFDISEYAVPAVQWACGSGVLSGRANADGIGTVLDPKGYATRAELAVMLMKFDNWLDQAQLLPVYHTVDLAQGSIILSAGKEEYDAYINADPRPAQAPEAAYVSQDGGATWTKIEGELVITSSEPTQNFVDVDGDAPCGALTVILDGVNTTGDVMLGGKGEGTFLIRGEVCVGTLVTGLGQDMTVRGENEKQTNILKVNSPYHALVASGDILVEDLDGLYVSAGKSGINTENGSITLSNVTGEIRGGEGCPAVTTSAENGVITVNGGVLEQVEEYLVLEG